MSQYRCDYCDKSFTLNKNLSRHVNNVHKQNEDKYKCDVCKYSSSRRDNFNRHKSSHRNIQNEESNSILCAMCNNFTCSTHSTMLQHYKLQHDIVFSDKECLAFESEKSSLSGSYVLKTARRVILYVEEE